MKAIIRSIITFWGAISSAEVIPISYSDNGVPLQGYLSQPPSNVTPLPAVIILSDWDGTNDYEKKRAEMITEELGYVAFAADVLGSDLKDASIQEKIAAVTPFRNDPSAWMARIQAAIDVVSEMNEVDSNRIGMIGYCFGGTGGLMYATRGYNDITAFASFHGGLAGINYGPEVPITTKLLILSGGDDDTSSSITDLEKTLNTGNATWEINRYADVEHGFTVWDGRAYNQRADELSWSSFKSFFREAMGDVTYEPHPAPMPPYTPLEYTDDIDGAVLEGYLSLPPPSDTRHPAVIILPDWDGVNTYETTRASMLADLGYIAFAADIYGKNRHNVASVSERIQLSSQYRSNVTLYTSRIASAVAILKQTVGESLDPEAITIAGYCFGGTGALMYALHADESHDEVHTIVSFHGGLSGLTNATRSDIKSHILVLSGGDDDTSSSIADLEVTLNAADTTWQISRYSDVVHGFTKFNSSAYNLRADTRSWEAMQTFHMYDCIFPGSCKVEMDSKLRTSPGGDDTSGSATSTVFDSVQLTLLIVGSLMSILF